MSASHDDDAVKDRAPGDRVIVPTAAVRRFVYFFATGQYSRRSGTSARVSASRLS
jgi:hypothetical protein